MPKLQTLRPRLRHADTRTARLPPRQIDPTYNSAEFQSWRAMVLERAGYRCEAIDNGHRCTRARPNHRLYADHVHELRDGGQPFDLSNGQALCASHHELKTIAARARRLRT
jgi:5-methylcytosine-specific restriction enzyme A